MPVVLSTGQAVGFGECGSYDDVAGHDPVQMHALMPATDTKVVT